MYSTWWHFTMYLWEHEELSWEWHSLYHLVNWRIWSRWVHMYLWGTLVLVTGHCDLTCHNGTVILLQWSWLYVQNIMCCIKRCSSMYVHFLWYILSYCHTLLSSQPDTITTQLTPNLCELCFCCRMLNGRLITSVSDGVHGGNAHG